MKKKIAIKSNSWSEYVHYAVKGLLDEPVPNTSIGKFTDELKLTVKEFKISENNFLSKTIEDIKPSVLLFEKDKFQKTTKRDENTRLFRKRIIANYLNYLRVKKGWSALRYDQTDDLSRYFIIPPQLIPVKVEAKPTSNKNSLIEFERMLLDGTFSKPFKKAGVANYLVYLNRALQQYQIKVSDFCNWEISEIKRFRENLKFFEIGDYKPKLKDLSDSKSAINKFIEYKKYKLTLDKNIEGKIAKKQPEEIIKKNVKLEVNISSSDLITLHNFLRSNKIDFSIKG